MSLYTEDEIIISASAPAVWNALVDPELTQQYMFGCQVKCNWQTGDSIEWIGARDQVVYVKGELVALEPEQRLSYTVFDPNANYPDIPENYLTATYELTPRDKATHIRVTQGDYSKVDMGSKRYQDTINQGGWSTVLKALKQVVEQGDHPKLSHSNSGTKKSDTMIITTTDFIPNREITEILGVARGSTVRARNVGSDFLAGMKNLVGGEIDEYTKLQASSREQALQRMTQDAIRLNADAVINVRLTTSMVMQGAAEILAYGTAVKLG